MREDEIGTCLALWIPTERVSDDKRVIDVAVEASLVPIEAAYDFGIGRCVLDDLDEADGAIEGGFVVRRGRVAVGCPRGSTLAFLAEWPVEPLPGGTLVWVMNDRRVQLLRNADELTVSQPWDSATVELTVATYQEGYARAVTDAARLRTDLLDAASNTRPEKAALVERCFAKLVQRYPDSFVDRGRTHD